MYAFIKHFFLSIFYSCSLIFPSLFIISGFSIFSQIKVFTDGDSLSDCSKDFNTSTCFFMLLNCVCLIFEIFSKSWINELSSFYILCYFRGNISSPIRHSYLSILPYYNADIVATSLLKSCSDFVSLILSPLLMITLYTSSNRFFQKR